ncbi:hypothetical protein [Halorhabdus sp. CUG00001]|uniref:hypothetical protein n=1 Tax=Halorhabdus sp. CUG00001 TaxID=2600297 RepID=UPI00131BAAD9|nr:hypothetical protein [Halorhabdus sp. CUG00001]
MTAIDPKASARYWARLFGYFLVLAVTGGGLTGGGIYLLDEAEAFPGGPAVDIGTELAAGGVLTTLGTLLVLAGFLTIVLNVVADGVRAGVEAAGNPAETAASDAETGNEPATDDAKTVEFAPGESTSAPRARDGRARAPSSQPRSSPEDDEAWKREVERKLQTESEGVTAERSAPRPEQTTADDSSSRATSQPDMQERADAGESVTRTAPTEPDYEADELPAETEGGDRSAEDDPETDIPADSTDAGEEDTDEWVSAETVRGEHPSTEDSEQSADSVAEATDDGHSTETPATDAPEKPRDASDLFSSDEEAADTGDESSDDPLAPDEIDPQQTTPSDSFPETDKTENEDDEDTQEPR